MTTHSLLLVGHGKLGSVLLERLNATAFFSTTHVISPHHTQADSDTVHWHRDLTNLPANVVPTIIIFAVKPALLETILPTYAARFATTPLYLSVAAGKTLRFYHQHLGEHAHVVRAMPNTPSHVGAGITTLCAQNTLSASARKIATDIMQTLGEVLWINDETQMNAATAIAGCGPAYVFLFIESLIKAGVQAGLSEAHARTLAMQTIKGSHALASHSSKTLSELCTQVASPGGATEAALNILTKDDALAQLMHQAVQAAILRSQKLST